MASKNECRTLSIAEVAKVLGIGRNQAYEAARRGEIPTIRIGRRMLVPAVAFERLQKSPSQDPPGNFGPQSLLGSVTMCPAQNGAASTNTTRTKGMTPSSPTRSYTVCKKLSFIVPLTKEESDFPQRLLHASNEVLEKASWNADRAELDAIYDNTDVVPADLRESIRRMDPRSFRETGILASYEETPKGEESGLWIEETGLWVRHDQSANVEFVASWLQEILIKFGHPVAIGFEWCWDCSRPVLTVYGGGACVVNKDGPTWFDSGDWVYRELERGSALR
jgi:excisionase family DNA binding protein